MRNRGIRIAVIIAILIAAAHLVVVPAGSFAVRESPRGLAPLGPGLHLRVPLYQRVYSYDSAPQTIDEPLAIVTRDNASFRVPVRLSIHASPGDVVTFHTGRAGRETQTYLQEQGRAAILAAARTVDADALLTSGTPRRIAPMVSAFLISRGIADDGLEVGDPGPQVMFNAVADYLKRDLKASARRLAEQAVARDPRQALHVAAVGLVQDAEGNRAAAEQSYLDALVLDPTAPEPMSRLYVLYQFTADRDKVGRLERLLLASLEKKQDSAMHHDWLGQVYLRTGRLEKAETSFNAAIGLQPQEPEFRVSLGTLKVRAGKFDEARAAFGEALRLRPGHGLATYNLGVVDAMQGKYDEAIALFLQAERAGQGGPVLWNALAQAHEAQGRYDRAIEYLKRSLQAKPEQPDRRAALKRLESRVKQGR
jgi:Flp pilus assembly protein TadD